MKIIISPAKKMNVDTDSLPIDSLPPFLPQTERLLSALQTMSPKELQSLWKCNDNLAQLNIERLKAMTLRQNLTPAILSYEGIQYRYIAPGVMATGQLEYLREHLRILSGFYGLLRPFDGVTPYRLEMQAKLSVGGAKDLYAFWGDSLAKHLEGDWMLNLASKEYSKAVTPYLPAMAQGQMVRWLAENGIEKAEKIREFADLEYRFDTELSTENTFVFIKGGR